MKKETFFAFDMGIGSLGECVRQDVKILHAESLILPAEYASTKSESLRRRQLRTRQSHQRREQWLDEVCREAGIPVLQKREVTKGPDGWELAQAADPRLEREFPEKNEDCLYTSCLLRIALLQEQPLEPWQVYKALRSAIQLRGYDPEALRRGPLLSEEEAKEAGENRKKISDFERELEKMSPGKPEHQYLCYYQAWKMGLWSPEAPGHLKPRIDNRAERARGVTAHRKFVESEIRHLIQAASKVFPKLGGQEDYVLYGPTEEAYQWKGGLGALAQKLPRIDNRRPAPCTLIPRLNVCRNAPKNDSDELPLRVVFLMKLKNMRIDQAGTIRSLTHDEFLQAFEKRKAQKSYTPSMWAKFCAQLDARPLPTHAEIKAPSKEGRSRFCRPALRILDHMLLAGNTPQEQLEIEQEKLAGNTDKLKGLVEEDLQFLTKMGNTWDGIYIPNRRIDALIAGSSPDEAIEELISSQRNPVVRHRLDLFNKRLDYLASQYGKPDHVVIEFVREDFMSEKERIKYLGLLKEREKTKEDSRAKAIELGTTGRANALKYELWKAQDFICLFTGECLKTADLDSLEIEHIVPRSQGGPDAQLNYVITTRKTNQEKGDRTPYEWLSATSGWDGYIERIKTATKKIGYRKAKLLTAPDAAEMVEKYTALAGTAWISRVAQTVVCLKFGFPMSGEVGKRKVHVVSGGLTARIRRNYRLNSLLNPDAESEHEAEKKNRKDDRHHALDAMVISFIPQWARDPSKETFFRFPAELGKNPRELFAQALNGLLPKNIASEKPKLTKTFYSSSGEHRRICKRSLLKDLAYKAEQMKKIYDLKSLAKSVKKVVSPQIQQLLLDKREEEPTEQQWIDWCDTVCLPKGGQRIKRVKLDEGEIDEYADLSKDRNGAYKRGSKGHCGQFLYLDENQKPRVRPVYVFESTKAVHEELESQNRTIVGFYQSGCTIQIAKDLPRKTNTVDLLIPAGQYTLRTLRSDGRAKISNPSYPDVEKSLLPARLLLKGGFVVI